MKTILWTLGVATLVALGFALVPSKTVVQNPITEYVEKEVVKEVNPLDEQIKQREKELEEKYNEIKKREASIDVKVAEVERLQGEITQERKELSNFLTATTSRR